MERRMTTNKRRILALFEVSHALSAHDIHAELSDMDLSTVYRNLERFEQDGVLRTITLEAGRTFYERTSCHAHAHFVCTSCNTVDSLLHGIEVEKRNLPRGARADHAEVVVHGRCAACA